MHPWRLPGGALLSNDWNRALDLAASLPVPVSVPELATAWERYGAEQVLVMLRALAAVGGEKNATTTGEVA
jgi:hypothetical protein